MKTNIILGLILVTSVVAQAEQPVDHLVFEGDSAKPGRGKHVVLISGDQEYRSEEALPMLAQILSKHHGFKCTVLFAMDAENKFVDPNNIESLSNPGALDSADLILMAIRWRKWNENAMRHFAMAFERGTPITALRTSTHPFKGTTGEFTKYGDGKGSVGGWDHGFGREVIGEKWVRHHGKHAKQGTRAVVEPAAKDHPILNGVGDIFGKTDVYEVHPKEPSRILLRGAVTESLAEDSKTVEGEQNSPMMPIAWTREYKQADGNTNRVFTTTMGSADDLLDADLRRLVINSVYHGLELDVPASANVKLVSRFKPTMYGFGDSDDGIRKGFIENMTPKDFVDFVSPKYAGDE